MIEGDRVKTKKRYRLRNAIAVKIHSDSWWDGTVTVLHDGCKAHKRRCVDILNYRDLGAA